MVTFQELPIEPPSPPSKDCEPISNLNETSEESMLKSLLRSV